VAEAATMILNDNVPAIRELYKSICADIRGRRLSVEDVCAMITVSKSPEEYRNSDRREEPYEVLLAAGRNTWRMGERVRFYRARGHIRKLADDFADDYDCEYYCMRLRTVFAAKLSKAIDDEGLRRLLDDQLELFGGGLEDIRVLTSRERSVGQF
jgi:DNA polymerase elongation subunit (family B)